MTGAYLLPRESSLTGQPSWEKETRWRRNALYVPRNGCRIDELVQAQCPTPDVTVEEDR